MNPSTTHGPVLLVFPPELPITKLQQSVVTAIPYRPGNPMSKLIASKLKILGTLQILFGMMHFSFGVIMLFTFVEPYPRFPLIFLSGYPFWSSILFINSGAFLIALKKKHTDTLMMMSRIMNSLSSLGAIAGVVLLSFSFLLDQHYLCGFSDQLMHCHAVTTLLIGIFIMLMAFTIIELFIALFFSIFGGQ